MTALQCLGYDVTNISENHNDSFHDIYIRSLREIIEYYRTIIDDSINMMVNMPTSSYASWLIYVRRLHYITHLPHNHLKYSLTKCTYQRLPMHGYILNIRLASWTMIPKLKV